MLVLPGSGCWVRLVQADVKRSQLHPTASAVLFNWPADHEILCLLHRSQGAASPSQLLLDSSPIMESFGNAKTVRNNNSSRFGKYMDLYFGSDKKIVNGNIKKYLLEKSRIVYQAPGERNYHVFFQVFHLPAAWQAQMKLTAPEDYFYLKQGGEGCSTVDGIDDAHELQLMRDAFERLQISDEDAIKMFSIVAAVMHLGNTQFEQSGDDTVQVSNTDAVAVASSLLGVNADKCTQTLVTREIKAGREIAIANNNKKQAQDSRDGLAKALYGKLFDHLTAMINEGIDGVKTGEKVNSIGVLDIFGFEIFKGPRPSSPSPHHPPSPIFLAKVVPFAARSAQSASCRSDLTP